MIAPPFPADLTSGVARSAARLAHDMVVRLGHDAGLAERVEVERSVAGVVAWLAAPRAPAPPASPRCVSLVRLALDAVADWGPTQQADAAAWQLALAALDLAHRPS